MCRPVQAYPLAVVTSYKNSINLINNQKLSAVAKIVTTVFDVGLHWYSDLLKSIQIVSRSKN